MLNNIRNKKGFTIIEIMVVIAIIGILAAVLVPQFAGVKEKARDTGVLTNARIVEAYVSSIIDDWSVEEAIGSILGSNDMAEAIETHFESNPLTNPYTGAVDAVGSVVNVEVQDGNDYSTGETGDDDAGVIYVVIDDDETSLKVYINGFDSKGEEIEKTRRTVIQ